MASYKRNQVEEAIAAVLDQAGPADAADLRIRIKRLLDVDRALDTGAQAGGAEEAYAFYTGTPPGRGVEVRFSPYEAFALLLGVLLLRHRWPQRTAVRIMRQARPSLEPAHRRILEADPSLLLFDEDALAPSAAPGRPAADPVFLSLVSGARPDRLGADALPLAIRICTSEVELMEFRRKASPAGTGMTVLELTAPALQLAEHLDRTIPKPRGRPGR